MKNLRRLSEPSLQTRCGLLALFYKRALRLAQLEEITEWLLKLTSLVVKKAMTHSNQLRSSLKRGHLRRWALAQPIHIVILKNKAFFRFQGLRTGWCKPWIGSWAKNRALFLSSVNVSKRLSREQRQATQWSRLFDKDKSTSHLLHLYGINTKARK